MVAWVARMVLWPQLDHPLHADAIVVLSGDHGERLPVAQRLLASGVAPVLVLAGTPDSVEDLDLCHGGQPFEVVCLRPNPDSTRAEARTTAVLATTRHWRHLLLVTSTTHLSRARLLFSRCVDATVSATGAPLPFGGVRARQARVHEGFGLLYALLWARGC